MSSLENPAGTVRQKQSRVPFLKVLVIVLLAMVSSSLTATAQIPSDVYRKSLKPTGDVNDFSGILNSTSIAELEQLCQELRHRTGAQLAVVVIQSMQGGQIDDLANKLFSQWGVGQAGKSNGILLLVAVDDHKARIEVGYGLEPIIPDALAGRILREQLFPSFKQQRYAEGLTAAVRRIVDLVERDQPASALDRRSSDADMPLGTKLVLVGFLAVFISIGSFLIGAGLGARVFFFILFGLFFGGIPFILGCLTTAPLAPIIHTCVGVVMCWLGWRLGSQSPKNFRSNGHRSRQYSDDTWIWGASSGSSSGSSGDWSSGGFSSDSGSFGGGSSGGGGASGSW